MYQLAIFDLDGTLLDSIKDLSMACNFALKSFGYKAHTTEAYKRFVGSGVYKLIERAMPPEKRTPMSIQEVKAVFDNYYGAHSLDYTKPYEGILELLEGLKTAGVYTTVLSNKPHLYTVELVERFFGEGIDKALGQRENVPIKPHPVGIQELLAAFDIPKEKCIYIGDSDIDMQTAKAAGVTSVGVLWGFRDRKELIESGADYLAADATALKEIILG